MTAVRDATVAARIPLDLRDDLERASIKAGDDNLTVTIRRLLRTGCDRELNGDPPPAALFAPTARAGAHHRDDPATSRKASRDNQPRSGSQRARLLSYIASHPVGLTYDECNAMDEAAGIPVAGVGYARRATELLDAGAIVRLHDKNGDPITRVTRNGSQAAVYIATTKGRAWATSLQDRVS